MLDLLLAVYVSDLGFLLVITGMVRTCKERGEGDWGGDCRTFRTSFDGFLQ